MSCSAPRYPTAPLRPLLRAYALGYGSVVAPRLLTLLLHHFTRKKIPLWPALLRILRAGLDWQRFPVFCAALVGGTTLLEVSTSASAQPSPA